MLSLTKSGFICVLVYCRTSDDTIPSQSIRDLLVGVAFCSTVAWLDLLASETVAVLETVGAEKERDVINQEAEGPVSYTHLTLPTKA